MKYLFFFTCCFLFSCQAQNDKSQVVFTEEDTTTELDRFMALQIENNDESNSQGTVGNGKLLNGKLFPFLGDNFHYFDTTSYISERAFLHQKLRTTVLSSYHELNEICPNREFCMMECSNKHGGKIEPHRTHQTGLSIDFMVPLVKNDIPYYGLDNMGAQHYLLQFDQNGCYTEDKEIKIDFNTIAAQLINLEQNARLNGLRISKVIFKIELKDNLFQTPNGQKLMNSGIYFAQSLSPLINSLHDDHFHVDFELIK